MVGHSQLNKEKIMYKYKVQVKKVSGRLNESVLPSKNLVVKSKTKKSDKQVFAEASKFFKKKYGLIIESADTYLEGDSNYTGAVVFLSPKEYIWKCCANDASASRFLNKEIRKNISTIRKNRMNPPGSTIPYIKTFTSELYSQPDFL